MTIAGFLPPVSITSGRGWAVGVGLDELEAMSRDPVNTTPSTRGCDQFLAHRAARRGDEVEHAVREAGLIMISARRSPIRAYRWPA